MPSCLAGRAGSNPALCITQMGFPLSYPLEFDLTSFTIPESVQKIAASALSLYVEQGMSGYAVAKATATRLSLGGKVTEGFVRKLSRYYPKGSRAEDPLFSALWGGKEGKLWAESTATANFSGGPDSVRVAEFNLNQSSSYVVGDYRVYPNSILFQAGDFPDKQITISASDLATRVANSEPVYLNLEHFDTDPSDTSIGAFAGLDGILGEVVRFWMDPADKTIARGEVHVLRILDDNLEKRGLSMEVPFTAGTGFDGGAITYTPRITGAAMMSELAHFKKEHTHSGISRIQQFHDDAERAGAICKGDKAKMSSAHEAKTFQMIHDTACEAGAKCHILSPDDVERIAKTGSYYYTKENSMPLNIKGIKSLFASWFSAGMPEDFSTDHEGLDLSGVRMELETTVAPVVVPVVEVPVVKVDFKQTEEYKTMADKIEAADNEKKANFTLANTAAIEKLLAEDKILPADVAFSQGWRAKDVEAFDLHFSTVKPLGNLSTGSIGTVDADVRAAQLNNVIDLAAPFSADQFKKAYESEKARTSAM